ncbi:MAG: SCP2 sterol-binding domain-containing protein [Candidatus Contendobacter sp.]|nr:SCP2 sterol-binding domain-containing protein [Candidatus Contendobacter sp.]MDS4060454.1 SCP2 sterol-binding domain-containing protein [Candidatus Contendobacter sp.]
MINAMFQATLHSLFPPRPTLPTPLALPLKLIPGPVHSTILTTALNVLFAARIQQDDTFEFLRNRILAIKVRDAQVEYRFRYAGPAGFVPCQDERTPDLTISGTLYDFLALATRREDSDTLFFNRRVVMEGDTALGLELKNLLDGMDPEALGGPLPPLLRAVNGLMAGYERLSG